MIFWVIGLIVFNDGVNGKIFLLFIELWVGLKLIIDWWEVGEIIDFIVLVFKEKVLIFIVILVLFLEFEFEGVILSGL